MRNELALGLMVALSLLLSMLLELIPLPLALNLIRGAHPGCW